MLKYLHCQLIYRRGAMYKEWASLSTDRDHPFSATNMTNTATSQGHKGGTRRTASLKFTYTWQ